MKVRHQTDRILVVDDHPNAATATGEEAGRLEATGAQRDPAVGGVFGSPRRGVEIWHLTGTTPRRPAVPRSGEKVSLWFRVSPMRPDLHLCLVVENFRADGLDEMPGVVKATHFENRNACGYWRCHIGPFREGDTVAYFVTGHWGGREIICGKQHWFRVRRAYLDVRRF
jgi:hypothetical protein